MKGGKGLLKEIRPCAGRNFKDCSKKAKGPGKDSHSKTIEEKRDGEKKRTARGLDRRMQMAA